MNIFFCYRPSQLYAADRIIKQLPATDKHIVVSMYTPDINQEKTELYTERLKKKSYAFLLLDFYYSTLLITYLKLLWITKLRKVTIFIASWDIAEFRILSTFLRIKEARTYDDGAINLVVKEEDIAEKAPDSIRVKYLLKYSKWSPLYLMKSSVLHYTFFPQIPQMMKKTTSIGILNESNECAVSDLPPVRLFIGQPVGEFTDIKDEAEYVDRIIKDKNIDYYFPHPREEFEISNKSKVVNSALLFEDYYATHFSDRQCVVYTFFSTTIFSLYGLNNVKAVSLRPQGLLQLTKWLDAYVVLEALGVEIEDLPY